MGISFIIILSLFSADRAPGLLKPVIDSLSRDANATKKGVFSVQHFSFALCSGSNHHFMCCAKNRLRLHMGGGSDFVGNVSQLLTSSVANRFLLEESHLYDDYS